VPIELECPCEETAKGVTISLDVSNGLQELQKTFEYADSLFASECKIGVWDMSRAGASLSATLLGWWVSS
jgi:hypothetical protein